MITLAEIRMIHDTESTIMAETYFPLGLIIEALKRAAKELESAAQNEVFDESPYPILMIFQKDTDGLETEIKITQLSQ